MDSSQSLSTDYGSDSQTRSGSGGVTGESSQSVGNNPPELSSPGGDTSSSTMTKTADCESHEEGEDMDIEISPTKHQTESSTGKGKEKMDDTAINSEGKAEEIGLLTDLHELLNKGGRYAFLRGNKERYFYKFWIQEEGEYGNKEELDNKIMEMHARFLKNMDKNVEGPTNAIDVEILRLSHWIWGYEIDSSEEIITGDDEDQDSKDSSYDNAGNDDDHGGVNPNDPKDSSYDNAGNDDDHGGVNPNDPKDSSYQETGKYPHDDDVVSMDTKDLKDSSSKPNEDGSPAS